MKMNKKKKLVPLLLLIGAVVAVTELQKFMKNRTEECADGVCKLPAEKIGALVGPQSVPILPSQHTRVQKPLPELIDFGAGECATCKMMDVVLTGLAQETTGRLRVRIVNVRENEAAKDEYAIRMIPTQVFLDAEGHELYRHEGFISKKDILKKWAELGFDFPSE